MSLQTLRRVLSLRTMLAVSCFLAVTLSSPPTTISSISVERPDPPTTAEIIALDELSQWVEGVAGSREFHLQRESSLGELIRERPQSFELFRSYHPDREKRRLLNRLPYGELINRTAKRHDVDGLLVAAVVEAESRFNPYAISPVGALGLMQVMPTTEDLWLKEDPFDPALNLDLGTRYLSRMLDRFDGDLELALAAYNAGPGAVLRHQGVPPYRETRQYVGRVLDRYLDHHQDLWRDHLERDWYLN